MTATTHSQSATEVVEVTQVIVRERQARDRGWWSQLPGFYHPEARIQTSWFKGTIPEYIERSREMAVKDPSGHRLGQPVVKVNGDRAVGEVPMTIEFRGQLRGVEVDVTVYIRFLHRLERRDGQWRLLGSQAVFERDTLVPSVPGAVINISPDEISGFRPSYRMLSLWLTEKGHRVGSDRYGIDRPDEVEALYRDTYGWAGLPVD
jgi:hypothetical protein